MTDLIFVILICHVAFGGGIVLTNPQRRVNQCFGLVALVLAFWLFSMASAFSSSDPGSARFWITQSFAVGALLPLSFKVLFRLVSVQDISWPKLVHDSRYALMLAAAAYLFSQTTGVVAGASLAKRAIDPLAIPDPLFGKGLPLYVLYVVLGYLWAGWSAVRFLVSSRGLPRVELEFILTACLAAAGFGLTLSTVLPLFIGDSQTARVSPAGVLLLDGIVAYGIATQRILDVRSVLRRVIAYGLLMVQLTLVFTGVWYLTRAAWPQGVAGADFVPSLLAAVLTALTVAPSHTFLQTLARRLFLNIHQLDFETTLKEANQLFRSIHTTPELLTKLASLLKHACGTDHVVVLVAQKSGLIQVYPETPAPTVIAAKQEFHHFLQSAPLALSLAGLRRQRGSESGQQAADFLKANQAEVFCTALLKDKPACMIVLGQRLSGFIYSSQDLNVLQILSQQFASALENATLYTQVSNSNAYNETLLDQLVTGVVAVDASGDITVCNREARRMLGVEPDEVLGRPVAFLPRILEKALVEALELDRVCRDVSGGLKGAGESEIPISISTRAFTTEGNTHLGVVLVFQDLSRIKALEEQLRRADRLSTLGALSASVAHEVKNPMVAIKTFVQLLPERIHDPEFLEAFSTLVGGEIKRIDKIVNQFLGLGRSEKKEMSLVRVHEVLETTLSLLHHDFIKRKVKATSLFHAADDGLVANPQKLQQVFLNLLMNAMDALPEGGVIRIVTGSLEPGAFPGNRSGVEVRIEDNGSGIPSELRSRIFDPFFTTKDTGTGLGLSICQNIITEHGGRMEVVDTGLPGSCLAISFPSPPIPLPL